MGQKQEHKITAEEAMQKSIDASVLGDKVGEMYWEKEMDKLLLFESKNPVNTIK